MTSSFKLTFIPLLLLYFLVPIVWAEAPVQGSYPTDQNERQTLLERFERLKVRYASLSKKLEAAVPVAAATSLNSKPSRLILEGDGGAKAVSSDPDIIERPTSTDAVKREHWEPPLLLFGGLLQCRGGAAVYEELSELALQPRPFYPKGNSSFTLPQFFPLHQSVTVYVQFSKVGSTTLRRTLKNTKAWADDLCFLHSGNLARSRQLKRHPFNYTYALDPRQLPKTFTALKPLIQGSFGACMKLRNTPCQYFTLLRDPIATMISSYSYFCKSCNEGWRVCREHLNLPIKIRNSTAPGEKYVFCPKLSFLEYAQLVGNIFTRDFSLAAGCHAYRCKPSCSPFHEVCSPLPLLTEYHLSVAKQNLGRVFVLLIEQLFACDHAIAGSKCITGIEMLARAFHWDEIRAVQPLHEYKAEYKYSLSNWEKKEVKKILALDIELYEHAKQRYYQYMNILA